MSQQFTEIIKDAIINVLWKVKIINVQYCGKEFSKESTLAAHPCEPKRLPNNNMSLVKLGMTAYPRFYEKTQGSAKFKTYADFSTSPIL